MEGIRCCFFTAFDLINDGYFVLKTIFQMLASIFDTELQTMICMTLLVISRGTAAISCRSWSP